VAGPGAWIFNGKVDPVSHSPLNDPTFQLKLLRPFIIIGILSMKYCSVVPKVVKLAGKISGELPAAQVLFMKSWEEGQALILHRNPQYFERDNAGKQLPYLDAVKISFLDNKATEFMEFQQGRLDFVNDIEASFKDEVLTKNGELKSV
jgi:peptide/nickel transport system substrate-binding protein